MAFQNSSAKSFLVPSQKRVQPLRQLTTRIGSGLLALGLSLSVALPSLAADPFRPDNGHDIGPLTEGAFEAIFKEGDYDTALTLLEQAETEEANVPLVQAMLSSLAYLKV